MEIVNWLVSNWKDIAEGIAMVVGVASIIVRLTPTLKDDNIFLPFVKFIGKYVALNVTVTKRPE